MSDFRIELLLSLGWVIEDERLMPPSNDYRRLWNTYFIVDEEDGTPYPHWAVVPNIP